MNYIAGQERSRVPPTNRLGSSAIETVSWSASQLARYLVVHVDTRVVPRVVVSAHRAGGTIRPCTPSLSGRTTSAA
jgi:hypothetical protein